MSDVPEFTELDQHIERQITAAIVNAQSKPANSTDQLYAFLKAQDIKSRRRPEIAAYMDRQKLERIA